MSMQCPFVTQYAMFEWMENPLYTKSLAVMWNIVSAAQWTSWGALGTWTQCRPLCPVQWKEVVEPKFLNTTNELGICFPRLHQEPIDAY